MGDNEEPTPRSSWPLLIAHLINTVIVAQAVWTGLTTQSHALAFLAWLVALLGVVAIMATYATERARQ